MNRQGLLVGVLVGGLLLRFVAVPLLHSGGYTGDENEYVYIARNVAGGEGFVDSNGDLSKRSPLFPIILAGLQTSGDRSLFVSHLLGCLLGVIAIALGYLLSLRLFANHLAAMTTAVVMAFYPGLVVYSALLQTESLYIVFFLGIMLLGYRILEKPSLINGAMLGLFCGLAALTRAVFLGFIPILLASLVLIKPHLWSTLAKSLGVSLIVVVLVILPWTVRNYLVHDDVVPISSWAGSSLLIGNNPYATGTWSLKDGFDSWFQTQAKQRGVDDPASLNEIEIDGLRRNVAVAYMVSHPWETAALFAKKAHMFWVYPITHSDNNLALQSIAIFSDFILLIGVCVGLVASWGKRLTLGPLFGAIVLFFVVHSVLHAEARYRLPLVPFLSVIFGLGFSATRDPGTFATLFSGPSRRKFFIASLGLILVVYGYTGYLFFQEGI